MTRKPNVLIPLPATASRGDQIVNASVFKSLGYSEVIEQAKLNSQTLLDAIHTTFRDRQHYIDRMSIHAPENATQKIVDMLEELAGQ